MWVSDEDSLYHPFEGVAYNCWVFIKVPRGSLGQEDSWGKRPHAASGVSAQEFTYILACRY